MLVWLNSDLDVGESAAFSQTYVLILTRFCVVNELPPHWKSDKINYTPVLIALLSLPATLEGSGGATAVIKLHRHQKHGGENTSSQSQSLQTPTSPTSPTSPACLHKIAGQCNNRTLMYFCPVQN